MDAMRASSRSRRLSSRKQPGKKNKLDEMYPWDSFWDYMLHDSELDDTSRESILWWRMKKREASRLAAIRQEIPITRSTSTQLRRVATDFQSEEDPMQKTMISKSDLDREEDEVQTQEDEREQIHDNEPHQLIYQHHPYSMESRDDDEDSEEDEEAECEDEDVSIAQSLFRENSVRQSDSQYQEYQSRDDEDSEDEDEDDDDMRPYPETPTSRQLPSEGSSKWKKKRNPTKMLKKKKQQGHGNKIPKSFKTNTRNAVDNHDDNTSSSTNTSPSLLVTHHMPTSNTSNNNNNNKQANFARKASSKRCWPLNTEDLSMSAESTNVSPLPPPKNNIGIQDQEGTTRSSDEDKRKLEHHQAFAVVACSKKSSRPSHQKKNKRLSASSSSRKQKFDVTPDEPAAALINSSIYKGYCRPRGLASLHKKVSYGRNNKHRGGVVSDGEDDDEILIAESAWLGVVNDGINNKSCAMDPAIALRPLQQPSAPTCAEPGKATRRRRRKKGVLRSLYRSNSHDADDDEDNDDEISLAESFLRPGHARLFL